MITIISPALAQVSTFAKPEDFLLQKGAWVRFGGARGGWNGVNGAVVGVDDRGNGVSPVPLGGNTFVIPDNPVLVRYPIPKIIPGADFIDLDLSNTSGTTPPVGTQQLYPESPGVVYQILLGFKKGHYFVRFRIAGVDMFALGSTYLTQPADITTSPTDNRIYLGGKTYLDSPEHAPLISLYAIQSMPNIVLRLNADVGIDYEKVVIVMNVNKCTLAVPSTPLTPEQMARALEIPWYKSISDQP